MSVLPVGAPIDARYEVRSFLGRGQFGEVYEVYDHNQGHLLALKLLNPAKVGPWPWAEATRLTSLRSRHILRIWNAAVAGGVPYIVTDLVAGTLEDLAGATPLLVPRESVRHIRDSSRGLARAHDDQILHRDIKLENLFVGPDNRTLVGDFGLAHPLNAAGEAPGAGTPATTAPEVMAGGNTTVRSDIYSLGASLYKLLTGVYPYLDMNPPDRAALAALVASGPPTPVRDLAPHVSQGLATRVEAAMSRHPVDRPATAAQFDADLGDLRRAERDWHRVPPHPGHNACWESVHDTVPIRVCVMGTIGSTRSDIETARLASGYRSRPNCKSGVTRAALPGTLRAIFQRLGN